MVEELDGLRVEGEVVIVLIIEEVDRVLVETKTQRLEERYVVSHHFLVTEVKLVHNDRVDVVVGKQIINARVIPDVLKENVQGLQELDAHVIVARLLIHELKEEAQHVSLEEEVKHGAVILVSPD